MGFLQFLTRAIGQVLILTSLSVGYITTIHIDFKKMKTSKCMLTHLLVNPCLLPPDTQGFGQLQIGSRVLILEVTQQFSTPAYHFEQPPA